MSKFEVVTQLENLINSILDAEQKEALIRRLIAEQRQSFRRLMENVREEAGKWNDVRNVG